MSERIVIMLGKNGDLMLLLPVLKAEADAGRRWSLMVAEKYAPLLEGVSYVDVIPFKGEHTELRRAWDEAHKLSPLVASAQVVGATEEVRFCSYLPAGSEHALTDSFAKEPWRLMGKLSLWKTHPPLVFDRRNTDREYDTFKKIKTELGYNKASRTELVLVSMPSETSPFPHAELLLELLNSRTRGKRRIMDISGIKVERLYDLLGLYDIAHCLIATDSAPLHLARACPSLPVIALVQDKPSLWHGAAWRPNHIAHCRYSDFPAQAVTIMERLDSIGQAGCITKRQALGGEFPRVIHAYPGFDVSAETRLEHRAARRTWQKIYQQTGAFIETPLDTGAFGRDTKTALGDKQRFPFLKDALRLACARALDSDLILLTRGVTRFGESLMKTLLEKAPLYSNRVLMEGKIAEYHPATDIFCFTKEWWTRNQKEIPDLVLGNDVHWHRVLREEMKRLGATDAAWLGDRVNVKKPVVSGPKAPRVAHNEKLAVEFLKERNVTFYFPPVASQQRVLTVNPHGLAKHGYNPSLIRNGDTFLMTYRAHTDGASTSLFVAELDAAFNVTANRPLEVPKGLPAGFTSMEDARLFLWRGQIHAAFVQSSLRESPYRSVMRVGRLVPGNPWTLADVFTPQHGRNDGSGMEKNWVFFAVGEKLFALYSQGPTEQLVLEIADGKVVAEHRSPSIFSFTLHEGRGRDEWPCWAFGVPKGGTPPIPYGDKLLRFFHSTLDNEPGPYRRRYYVGAVVTEAQPPFAPLSCSTAPLLCGSEADDTTEVERSACAHWKSKVIFPGGACWVDPAKELGMGVHLALGVNDCRCAIATINNLRL